MAKDIWTQEEQDDDLEFKNKVFSVSKSALKFSVPNNLKRLNAIRLSKDAGVYNLCLTAFVEGYFRDICNIDFETSKDKTLLSIFRDAEKKIPSGQVLSRTQQQTIDFLFGFIKTKTKDRYTRDENGTGKWVPYKYYACADRVRHCFANQDERNIPFLVECFIDFTKIYGLYQDNKELIDSLIIEDGFFKTIANRQRDEENEEKLLKIGETLIQLMNSGSKSEKEEAKAEFSYQQEQQAIYAKSWRNYHSMMSTLTTEQKSISTHILKQIKNGKPIKLLIKGGPGTGKTLILLNVLQRSLNKNVILLTYTSSLTKYNEYLANTIRFNDTEPLDAENKLESEDNTVNLNEIIRSKISTFDVYFKFILSKALDKKIVLLNDFKSDDVPNLCGNYDFPKDTTMFEYIYEQAKEIWLHLPNKEDYIKCTYSMGKTHPIDSSKWPRREKIWNLINEWSTMLNSTRCHCIPLEYAYYIIHSKKADMINNELKTDYLLIDEIQDLEAAKMETIQKFTRKGYVFTGDMTQSVFVRKALPWGHLLQLKIPELKQKLTENFRSTSPIQKLVNEYRNQMTIIDKDVHTISNGFIPGPLPEGYLCINTEQTFDKILERIHYLKNVMFFSNKEIYIAVPNEQILSDIKDFLKSKGLESENIESDKFNFSEETDKIRLSKIKYIKGIDIPALLIILNEDYTENSYTTNDNLDIYGQENGLYAAMARAMNILNIFFINNSSSYLSSDNSVANLYKIMKKQIIEL